MIQIYNTRLVANYSDRSELHFVPALGFYSWQQPVADSKGCLVRMEETILVAGDDAAALQQVRKIIQGITNEI